MKIYKMLLIILLMFFLVSASESIGTFKLGDSINLIQSCDNSTYSNITRVLNPNGLFLLNTPTSMTKLGNNYNYSLTTAQTSGDYIVYGNCDVDGIDKNWVYNFFISQSGLTSTTSNSILNIGLLFLLIIFFGLCLFGLKTTDKIWLTALYMGLGYFLLTLIFFIAWTITHQFFQSVVFIQKFFEIGFYILIVGLPFVIFGLLIWNVYMVLTIKEIQNLMDKGIPEDEAYERKSRSSRGSK